MALRKGMLSADRGENIKRTQTRAGKSKGNVAQRARQNATVKDGDIRIGKSGKSYNVWDAKTQTWKRGEMKTSSRSSSYPIPSFKRAGAGAEGPKRSMAKRAGAGAEGPKRSVAKRAGAGAEGPKVSRARRANAGAEGPKVSRANAYRGSEGPKRSMAKRAGAGSEGPKVSRAKKPSRYGYM